MAHPNSDHHSSSIIDQIARLDFNRAHQKAFWREVTNALRRHDNNLLPYDEVRKALPLKGQHYLGPREISVEQIVGSESRYHDFDRAFLPRQTNTKERWISIDRAHLEDVALPPIELYKVGEAYFVKDGNHRVSVARQKGQVFIDAVVIEVDVSVPLEATTDLEGLVLKAAQAGFEDATHLNEICPDTPVVVTLPGMYERLLEHISVHRWYLGLQRNEEVPYPEAVQSWYDLVYLPLISIIRENNILRQFPRRTETDLYLWIIEHRSYLEEKTDRVSLEDAAQNFADQYSERPFSRIKHALYRFVGRLFTPGK